MLYIRTFLTYHIHMSLNDHYWSILVSRCARFINNHIIHLILNIFQIMILYKLNQIVADLLCIS